MGCYKEPANGRLLKNGVSLSASGGANNATIGNCMSACQAKGYKYCGEEYYSECYGSNTEPTLDLLAGADPIKAGCNFPCKGNSAEVSGFVHTFCGRIADSIYSLAVDRARSSCTSTTALLPRVHLHLFFFE